MKCSNALTLYSVFLLLLLSGNATAVEITQVVSRENPLFQGTGKAMSVGHDGFVYVASGKKNKGFVLRVSRDGKQRFGAATTYAITGVAANTDGIVATSNAHFAKAVTVYGRRFQVLGKTGGFTGNDDVGWNAPGSVETGAKTGEFYGLDQHVNLVRRVSAAGKLTRVFQIQNRKPPSSTPELEAGSGKKAKASLDDLLDRGSDARTANRKASVPPWGKFRSFRFRVCEAASAFYYDMTNGIRCVGFDGETRWLVPANLGGDPWSGFRGAFDVDANGTLYVADAGKPVIKTYDSRGRARTTIVLKTDRNTFGPASPIADIRVYENELIVRRKSGMELFRVFDLTSGEEKHVVAIDHDRLTMRYPEHVWTQGKRTQLEIEFESSHLPVGQASSFSTSPQAGRLRHGKPDLRVWLRPLGDVEFTELPIENGNVILPTEAQGLYHLKVGAGLNGCDSQYQVQSVVEIRPSAARGSISIFAPLNRRYYGRGESIPITVIARTNQPDKAPEALIVRLADGQQTLWQTEVHLTDGIGNPEIPNAVTRDLESGSYVIDTTASGWTVAAQYVEIGPGLESSDPFFIIQHGDYYMGFPKADFWNAPEQVDAHVRRSKRIGLNLFVDRLGHGGSGLVFGSRSLQHSELLARLRSDPLAVAPEKARLEHGAARSIAAYGANGIREQAILLYMDAGLPVGTGFDKRTPEKMKQDVAAASEALSAYPAFRGWSWAANWWFGRRNTRLQKSRLSEKTQETYLAALKEAQESGTWTPILDKVSDIWVQWPVEAESQFDAVLQSATPGKISAMTAPYRQPLMIPPLVFHNTDEVDLHFQGEQIQWPQISTHNVDFYKRPGKRAYGHPELKNDNGTGGQILPTSLQMVMRGADGVGQSGDTKGYTSPKTDPRGMGQGTTSIHRTLNELLHAYGPWLRPFETADPIVIPVSTRMMRIEDWKGIGGWHFTRLYEAYQACLYAHRPARFVFVEDLLKEDHPTFTAEAVLVISQTVELDPPLAGTLKHCQDRDVPIYFDDTCRAELLETFAAKPLGIAFDRVNNDPHTFQDDAAYLRFQHYSKTHAERLTKVLGAIVRPVALCENPEIQLTEMRHGEARLLWVLNNQLLDLDPGLLWRVDLAIANRMPVRAAVRWNVGGHEVYDLFAGTKLKSDAILDADLRTLPARLYLALPPGSKLPKSLPTVEDRFGAHLRDIAVSADGKTAILNAANWDRNLLHVNLKDGSTISQQRLGHHFAYAPQTAGNGFAAQAYDLKTAEGYHLYLLDSSAKPNRRFALYGLPKRGTNWANAKNHPNPINNFAVPPDGSWVASAGDLGLVVWDRNGNRLWSDDWWRSERKRVFLLAPDNQTLVTMSGFTARAREVTTGKTIWEYSLGETGSISGATASQDGRVVVLKSSAEGGRLYVVRDGKPANAIAATFNEVALSNNGNWIAVTEEDRLRLYHTEAGLRWSHTGDDLLRYPCFAPDNDRIAVGSEIGTLYVLDARGRQLVERDLGSLPVAAWLADGDLLAATWMGRLMRFDKGYSQRWSTVLKPDAASWHPTVTRRVSEGSDVVPRSRFGLQRFEAESFLEDSPVPTTRVQNWGNAAAEPAALTPNLLTTTEALIEARCDPPAHADPRKWHHDIALLRDGDPSAPETPWLGWTDINYIDSGWRQKLTLVVDTFRSQIRLDGVTFVEDPNHPQSWLRDMRLQYWDSTAQTWQDGPLLLSNQATHTHWFDQPIKAAKFRFVSTGGGSWPVGNIRLGELVFHGEVLGCSHPDAAARRPLAVLFDEVESDLRCMMAYGGRPFEFRYDEAFSGNKSLALTAAGSTAPHYRVPFGHTVPNWDFEIVQNPRPGQYRWLEFAWKALSPATKGMVLHVGPHQQGGLAIVAGQRPNGFFKSFYAARREPSEDWKVIRIDLWTAWGGDFRLRSLALHALGDGALFDRIQLSATEAALDPSP